ASMRRLEHLGERIDAVLAATSGATPPRVCFAVAESDGHPDFQRLLRRVEFAIAARSEARVARA
ncbi:MAG: hypothetical protein RLW62_22485, partial [Gammaproteobacteria bacterium]